MKTKIAMSVLVIVAAIIMMVGSTAAYFSDTGTASHNTFKAGTLNIMMSSGGGYAHSIADAWATGPDWQPGGTISAALDFTNTGSINAKYVYFNFIKSGSDELMNNIIVTSIVERFNGNSTGNLVAGAAASVGNNDGVLTLNELVSVDWYSCDDQSGDSVILHAGDKKDYSISFSFKFPEDAGEESLGQSASFDLRCKATRNSLSSGFVPVHR